MHQHSCHSCRSSQRHLIASHKLITANLNAYGFGFNSLKLINDSLSQRKQTIKINHFCSSSEEVLFGVLQGSILGPILFNVFLSDLFLIIKDADFASYADDNTVYKASNNTDDVIAYYSSYPESSSNGFKINEGKHRQMPFHHKFQRFQWNQNRELIGKKQ